MRAIYLMLTVKGTTDTAQTLDEADIGRIRIQRDGDQVQGEDFEFYFDLANLLGGYPHKTAPTAGASRITAFIPFYFPGIRNALDVRDKEEVDVYLDFSGTLDTRFGANSATYQLHAAVAPGIPERYELRVEEQDVVASGAGRYDQNLNGNNIGAIFFRDPSSVVDKLQVQVDDEVAVDNIDDAALLDQTTFERNVESAAGGLIEVNNAPGGSIAETRNQTTELDAEFSGAGTLEVTKFRVIPSARADSSRAAVQNRLRSQVAGNVSRPTARPRGARR